MKFILIKILKFFLYPFKDILITISNEFIEKKIFNSGLIISNQNFKKFKKNKQSFRCRIFIIFTMGR